MKATSAAVRGGRRGKSGAGLTVPLGELRYVSLTRLARETGRRPEFWAAHWHLIPGAETYPSGHRRAPIQGAKAWQMEHRQRDCRVCGNKDAEAVEAPASSGR